MAISNKGNAVKLAPNGHPDKPLFYATLGNALQLRFQHLGALVDLEMAISNLENAVRLTPSEHTDKPSHYNNLGLALRIRFQRLGSLVDLEMAISNLGDAVRLTPNEHTDKPLYYSNLGLALQLRFQRLGALADLETSIFNLENAVRLTSNKHREKPSRYNSLGNAFQSRFERLGALVDLEMAISNREKAVNLAPDGHPHRPSLYGNLGAALHLRFQRLGHLSDLEKAFSNQEKALSLTPDGNPDKVTMTCNLARSYEHCFSSFTKRSDLYMAHSLYATAAQSPVGYPQQRFEAALGWSHCAKLLNTSPLPAFKCMIDQLPRIAWLGIPVSEQHSLLEDIGGAVRDAVAAAIEAEEYGMAVEWVEQGRAIVWQNLLKLRAPVDDLRAVYPRLADHLQSVSQQLDAPSSRDLMPQIRQDKQTPEAAKSHPSLAIEWDETVDQIRKLPNFESFLEPMNFDALSPVVHEGPVVILNVAQDRCDALALLPDENGVSSVISIPLETFSLEKSRALFENLTSLLKEQPKARAKGMSKILLILWNDLVKPVIDCLAYQPQTSNLPRIWWCATGLLTFLPIHAAGDYNKTEAGHKLSDYVVSSYTPTLTAILDSSYPKSHKDFKLLTVAQPSAPGAQEIPKTMEEVERIAKVATFVSVVNITKEAATVERVQKGMKESNWVHLACHGKQDASTPLDSGLLLYDGTLKLSTIIKETLPNAEFAFLSACQTAMGDMKVAEESAHLAAGMLLAGYKGVIATMWSIRDDIAPQVTEVVYSRMLKDGRPNRREAAYALHEAVRLLRESGADFTSWVPFIHIGR